MPSDDITLGELARQLAAADQRWEARLRQILDEIREDRRQHAEAFLRKDVYEANRKADRDDVDEIRRGQAEQVAFKRQIIVGAAVGLLLIVANIVVALMGLPGGAV